MNKYITEHSQFKTVDQAFEKGRQTGLTWDAPWVPGGPYVVRERSRMAPDKEWDDYCDFTLECNRAWMRGWEAGRKEATGESK